MIAPLPTDRVPTDLPEPEHREILQPFNPDGVFGWKALYPHLVLTPKPRTCHVIPARNVPWARGWGDREANMLLFWVVLRRAWKHTFVIEIRGARELAEAEDYMAIFDRKAASAVGVPELRAARWAIAEREAARTLSTGLPTWSPPDSGAFPPAHVRVVAPVIFGRAADHGYVAIDRTDHPG